MPNKTKRLIKLSLSGFFSLLLIWSCENDPASIGLDTLPTSDILNANSITEKIYGLNQLPDRVVSDNHNNSASAVLGYFKDPQFGIVKADFVTEVTLSNTKLPSFIYNSETGEEDANKFFPDSLVLHLAYGYENWYGDEKAKHKIQIYELAERLDIADSEHRYYSNYEILGKHYSKLLAEKEFSAFGAVADTMTDSIWGSLKNAPYIMKIRLDDELAGKLFSLSKNQLSDPNSLKDAFNGLYITTAGPENPANFTGSLTNFSMMQGYSKLVLHYRKELRELSDDNEEGKLIQVTPLSYTFPINKGARFFNRYTHQYTSEVEWESTDASRLMVQGLAGSYSKIDLSEMITLWADSLSNNQDSELAYGISGVDLVFYVDTLQDIDELRTPISSTLSIRHQDENGNPVYAGGTDKNDKAVSAFLYPSASYDKASNSYTFKMNQEYFQKAATGEIEIKPFYLYLPASSYNFNRVMLFNKHEKHHPKLKVKYVKYSK